MIKNRRTKSIGINAILNVINQGMRVVFPLITYPYAIRVLGADGIGRVNYSNSIVGYFSLFAMLGVSTYAVREGAKRRENKDALQDFVGHLAGGCVHHRIAVAFGVGVDADDKIRFHSCASILSRTARMASSRPRSEPM